MALLQNGQEVFKNFVQHCHLKSSKRRVREVFDHGRQKTLLYLLSFHADFRIMTSTPQRRTDLF